MKRRPPRSTQGRSSAASDVYKRQTQWYKPLRKNLGKKNCELSEEDVQKICDTFTAFEETEQSKIFPNAAFGYWKVTVECPLRLKGIDPTRAYSPKEIKALKADQQPDEAASLVIRKIHKKGAVPDSIHGLFETTINGKPAVVEYEPCLLYTSPSPRDRTRSRMPSSA